jgi:hypothetical protein
MKEDGENPIASGEGALSSDEIESLLKGIK